ncbi:hypothetical protein LH23_07170 [Cedecea neteri]|uniref:DUF1330 domain-containing protein n=1 Tax=Cedecea neteri TaxID=158822 RepID=A0AAN0VSQ2_9ENTR|nr:DUF1330 domain-containing protein [Cedecea neteri]AIR60442.1 hypothetical protein LH23_07170 [Cedecea neteri]
MAAYWIAHVTVHDPKQYQNYIDLSPAAFTRYNARFLARGGKAEVVEGDAAFSRHVVIEFADMETALACYHSPEYQRARQERANVAEAMIAIVEGLPG